MWVVADTVAGSGSIRANGQNGWDTVNEGNDGAGGGGAGGTVVVAARALGGVSIQANGGSGGNQYIRNHGDEAEGPGGGGGGGYIAVAGGTVSRFVYGGSSGWTDSRSMTEFLENGATAGGSGQLATVTTLPMCLPSDLAIAVTDNLAGVYAGAPVTYTVTVTNHGPNAVSRAKVTDVFPGILRDVSWTCAPATACGSMAGTGNIQGVLLTLASGGTATFTVTGSLDPAAGGTLSNTATVEAPMFHTEPSLANNSATDETTLNPAADLAVALTASPDPVNGRETLTYTLSVTNLGPSNAESVTAKLHLPAGAALVRALGMGWTCGQTGGEVACLGIMASKGAQPPISVVVIAPNMSGTITATASVDAMTADPVEGNNIASQSTTVMPGAPVVSTLGVFVNTQRPIIGGTAQAGGTVTVVLNGRTEGVTTASTEGIWVFIPATALTDGQHWAMATVMDASGNVSLNSQVRHFTVDTVRPGIPAVSMPSAFIATPRPVLGGMAEPGSTVTVWLDDAEVGIAKVDTTGFWRLVLVTDLPAGFHQVEATAMDAAENVSDRSVAYGFTVDLVVPGAPEVSVPGLLVNTQAPAIGGTAEPGSTVTVRLNGSVAGRALADATGNWNLIPDTALAEGSYQLEATATDLAGNVSQPSEVRNFRVDSEPPEAPELRAPGSFINTRRPAIAGMAEAGSTVTVWLDGIVAGIATTNTEGLWVLVPAEDLEERIYQVEAKTADVAGNVSPLSETRSFTIDLGPPDAPEVNSPEAFIDTHRPVIGGTAEVGSTVTVVLDGLDAGTSVADATGTWRFTPAMTLAGGDHMVVATAKDQAGNSSPYSAQHSFIIRKSHYGWNCTSTPSLPATWALLILALSLSKRRLATRGVAPPAQSPASSRGPQYGRP